MEMNGARKSWQAKQSHLKTNRSSNPKMTSSQSRTQDMSSGFPATLTNNSAGAEKELLLQKQMKMTLLKTCLLQTHTTQCCFSPTKEKYTGSKYTNYLKQDDTQKEAQ